MAAVTAEEEGQTDEQLTRSDLEPKSNGSLAGNLRTAWPKAISRDTLPR